VLTSKRQLWNGPLYAQASEKAHCEVRFCDHVPEIRCRPVRSAAVVDESCSRQCKSARVCTGPHQTALRTCERLQETFDWCAGSSLCVRRSTRTTTASDTVSLQLLCVLVVAENRTPTRLGVSPRQRLSHMVLCSRTQLALHVHTWPPLHKLVATTLLRPTIILPHMYKHTITIYQQRHYNHHYQQCHISHCMVKLPTLSNKVVQTSSETTSEVHVRSAVEDVK
jgi:ribosomal protein S19